MLQEPVSKTRYAFPQPIPTNTTFLTVAESFLPRISSGTCTRALQQNLRVRKISGL